MFMSIDPQTARAIAELVNYRILGQDRIEEMPMTEAQHVVATEQNDTVKMA